MCHGGGSSDTRRRRAPQDLAEAQAVKMSCPYGTCSIKGRMPSSRSLGVEMARLAGGRVWQRGGGRWLVAPRLSSVRPSARRIIALDVLPPIGLATTLFQSREFELDNPIIEKFLNMGVPEGRYSAWSTGGTG